ncbi:MAG TPA: cation diffusion facilitator family transporter [Acidimicrobiia bacterium]|nr:cation diffusion facilitator family transporter [Acidimicrobiia bacterium]
MIALSLNAAFLGVEIVGGFVFGSLALLADGAHMVSDVVALAMAFAALRIARRPPTERHTFGFGRTEVLVAQANGILLLAGAIVIVVEAVRRLQSPQPMTVGGVLVIGVIGLLVNAGSAAVVARSAGNNLNMRGALWHLLADALGSIAVIVAAVGEGLFGAERLDPIASILIAVLVVAGAARLLRDATRVLLEAVPADLDAAVVRAALCDEKGVDAVHHLHLWTTGSEHAALSAHVVLGGPMSLHDAQLRSGELKRMLADRFGIEHATLEVECHTCVDDEAHERSH